MGSKYIFTDQRNLSLIYFVSHLSFATLLIQIYSTDKKQNFQTLNVLYCQTVQSIIHITYDISKLKTWVGRILDILFILH